jgi:hypothetical protein
MPSYGHLANAILSNTPAKTSISLTSMVHNRALRSGCRFLLTDVIFTVALKKWKTSTSDAVEEKRREMEMHFGRVFLFGRGIHLETRRLGSLA